MTAYKGAPNGATERYKWLEVLTDEDLYFIENLLLQSGSLKALAQIYDVTYPTLRLRLNRLIEKVELAKTSEDPPYVLRIKGMALEGKISYETAKELVESYRELHKKV